MQVQNLCQLASPFGQGLKGYIQFRLVLEIFVLKTTFLELCIKKCVACWLIQFNAWELFRNLVVVCAGLNCFGRNQLC